MLQRSSLMQFFDLGKAEITSYTHRFIRSHQKSISIIDHQLEATHDPWHDSGQITTVPKPDLRWIWGGFPYATNNLGWPTGDDLWFAVNFSCQQCRSQVKVSLTWQVASAFLMGDFCSSKNNRMCYIYMGLKSTRKSLRILLLNILLMFFSTSLDSWTKFWVGIIRKIPQHEQHNPWVPRDSTNGIVAM